MAKKNKAVNKKTEKEVKRLTAVRSRGFALTAELSASHIGVSGAHKPEFQATSSGCLDKGTATLLVFSCTGVGAIDPDITLDVLSAGDAIRRQGFCGCVFNKAAAAGAAVTFTDIPCEPNKTVNDVIDSISC